MRIVGRLSALLVLGALAGCGPREHLLPDFGRSAQLALARQKRWPEPAKGSPRGLDSEEAALIQRQFLKSLGGQEELVGSPSRMMGLQEPVWLAR